MRKALASFLLVAGTWTVAHATITNPLPVGILQTQVAAAAGGGGSPTATLVQSTAVNVPSGNIATKAFGSNTTAGNLIVAHCNAYAGSGPPTVVSFEDTGTNTYTLVKSSVASGANNILNVMYYAANIAGGANTFTATFGGETGSLSCTIAEYSGLSTSSPLENSNAKSAVGTEGGGGPLVATANTKLFTGSIATYVDTTQATFTPLGGSTRRGFHPDNRNGIGGAFSDVGSTEALTLGGVYTSSFTVNNGTWIGINAQWK